MHHLLIAFEQGCISHYIVKTQLPKRPLQHLFGVFKYSVTSGLKKAESFLSSIPLLWEIE